jgi:hypothetical protein
MAHQKLTPDHEKRILALAGSGKTNRQIVADLATSGLTVSHTAIGRFLSRTKASRADAAKNVVREKLVGGLTEDLDRLELEAARLAKMARTLGGRIEADKATAKETLRYFRVVDRLAKLTDLKLHYAGADTPDDTAKDDGATERVLAKIRSMLEPDPTPEPAPPVIQ